MEPKTHNCDWDWQTDRDLNLTGFMVHTENKNFFIFILYHVVEKKKKKKDKWHGSHHYSVLLLRKIRRFGSGQRETSVWSVESEMGFFLSLFVSILLI